MKKIKKSSEKWPNIPNYLHISDPKYDQFHHKISLALWDQSLPTASGGLVFAAHKKMHISEYVCKTCLKESGILLKWRETFEKFLAACISSKNTGVPQFFFYTGFRQLHFKTINFPTKTKRCLLSWLLWIENYNDWQRQAKPHFPKK